MSAPTKPASLLEQGLAHAQALALLPDDAHVAIIGVADGNGVRAGVVARVGTAWQVSADLGIQPTTKRVTGRVMVIGKL